MFLQPSSAWAVNIAIPAKTQNVQQSTLSPPISMNLESFKIVIAEELSIFSQRDNEENMSDINVAEGYFTVLLVEDNPTESEEYIKELKARGYQVIHKENGLEALAFLKTVEELPTVILTDYDMTHMKGKHFVEEVRQMGINIPIILHSKNENHKWSRFEVAPGEKIKCLDKWAGEGIAEVDKIYLVFDGAERFAEQEQETDELFNAIHNDLIKQKNVFYHRSFAAFLTRHIPFKKRDRVLDWGTASGIIAIYLAKKGAGYVLAIDNHRPSLELARKNIEKFGFKKIIKIVESEGYAQINENEKFDTIVLFGTIPTENDSEDDQQLYDPRGKNVKLYLSRAEKYLAKGGKVILLYPDNPSAVASIKELGLKHGLKITQRIKRGTDTDVRKLYNSGIFYWEHKTDDVELMREALAEEGHQWWSIFIFESIKDLKELKPDPEPITVNAEDVEFVKNRIARISEYINKHGIELFAEGIGLKLSKQKKQMLKMLDKHKLISWLDEIRARLDKFNANEKLNKNAQLPLMPPNEITDQSIRCEYIFTIAGIGSRITLNRKKNPEVVLSYNSTEQNLLRQLLFSENYDIAAQNGAQVGKLERFLSSYLVKNEKVNKTRENNKDKEIKTKTITPYLVKRQEKEAKDPNYFSYSKWKESEEKNQAKRTTWLGQRAEVKGNYGQAEQLYRQAIKNSEIYLDAWRRLIELLFKTGQLEKAELLIKQALRIVEKLERDLYRPHLRHYGRDAHAFFLLKNAMLLYERSNYAEALSVLNLAQSKNPNRFYTGRIFNFRAEIYRNRGDLEKAEACLDEAISLNPEHIFHYVDKVSIYLEKEEFDKAFQTIDEAIESMPNKSEGYHAKAKIYLDLKMFDHALELINKAIKLEPDYYLHYHVKGLIYYYYGNYRQAILSFKKALEINPNHVTSLNLLAQNYARLGKYKSAFSCITKAIALDPNMPEYHRVLADIQVKVFPGRKYLDVRKDFLIEQAI